MNREQKDRNNYGLIGIINIVNYNQIINYNNKIHYNMYYWTK